MGARARVVRVAGTFAEYNDDRCQSSRVEIGPPRIQGQSLQAVSIRTWRSRIRPLLGLVARLVLTPFLARPTVLAMLRTP